MTNPDHPILFVDLTGGNGRLPFRCIPAELWGIDNNLNIANMDWEGFASAADRDGVFRGFRDQYPNPRRLTTLTLAATRRGMTGCWRLRGQRGVWHLSLGRACLVRERLVGHGPRVRAGIRHIAGSELSLCETRSELSLCEDLSQVVAVSASRDGELWAGRTRHRRSPPC